MTLGAWTPAMKRLIARGRVLGHVTVDEINRALPQHEVSSEFIEHVLATLSEAGVNVVEGEDGTGDGETVESPVGPLSPLPLQSGAEAPLASQEPEDDFGKPLLPLERSVPRGMLTQTWDDFFNPSGADLSEGGQSEEVRK